MKFYYEIIRKLADHEPFKLSRWGDGEWGCMYGWEGKNRDGNEYLPELKTALENIITFPHYLDINYYLGLQYGVLYNHELREFVFKHLFEINTTEWVNGDILHQVSEFGHLQAFVNVLKKRHVVVIGAEYFNKLPYQHIITPPTNSFLENDRILNEAKKYGKAVFLVASAMNSNVIIDRLPDNVTAIDIGSVFDPYLGKPRASYQHNMKAEWLW